MKKRLKTLLVIVLAFSICVQPASFVFANATSPNGEDGDNVTAVCPTGGTAGGPEGCDPEKDDSQAHDPVSTAGGKLYFGEYDLELHGNGKNHGMTYLYVRRSYSSQTGVSGAFGKKFWSNLDVRMTAGTESATLIAERGNMITYTFTPEGDAVPPACEVSSMKINSEEAVWTMKYGTIFRFKTISTYYGGQFDLQSVEDRYGNKISYEYGVVGIEETSSGNIERYKPVRLVEEATGRYIKISWKQYKMDIPEDPGNTIVVNERYPLYNYIVTSIEDSTGRKVTYDYDITNYSISLGPMQGTFNSIIALLKTVTDPEGNTIQYEYSKENTSEGEQPVFAVTNKLGYQTKYYFDTSYDDLSDMMMWDWRLKVGREVDPMGKEMVFETDDNLSLMAFNDKNGNTGIFQYKNMMTEKIVYPDGKSVSYEYDENSNLKKKFDRNGNTQEFEYNDKASKTKEVDQLGQTVHYEYDAESNKWNKIVDKNGSTWQRELQNGAVVSETDPLGNEITYETDQYGNICAKTDALGSRIEFTYDTAGNLVSIRDAEGNVWTYTYDGAGNKLSETDPEGNTTSYTYNKLGHMLSKTNPDGGKETYAPDPYGNVLIHTDAMGNMTTYSYDAMKRLTETNFPDGTAVTYEYDDMGSLIAENRPNGTYRFEYDEMNRKSKVIAPDGSATLFGYEPTAGCLTCGSTDDISYITDANGNTISYDYDPVGRKILDKDALNNAKEYEYDPNSNLTKLIDELGHQTAYAYDASNRLIAVTNHLGETIEISYDGNGNKTAMKDAKGNITRYEYNKNNMVTKVIDANGGETLFTYDSNNNRNSVTDPEGNTTVYEYDSRDRLVRVTDARGIEESFAYDLNGNLIKKTNSDGSVITYQYDSMNRLIKKNLPKKQVVFYTYDSAGNLKSINDTIGLTMYDYDALNRLTEVAYPGNYVLKYEYDAVGNRTKLVYPSGTTVHYSYDVLNRLVDVNVEKGTDIEKFKYEYDAKGRRTVLSYPNGIKTQYAYDEADRLLSISAGTETDPVSIESIAFTYDENGNRISREDTAGMHAYAYDPNSQLTEVTYPDGEAQKYTFDRIGNRTQLQIESETSSETITSVFNELNQLVRLESSLYEGGDVISLSGMIQDENIDKILINGKEAKIKGDTYSLEELKLKPGVNIVTVEVIDLAGNTVSSDFTITLDEEAKVVYSYDKNGNLKTKSEKGTTWTFKWDAENHLVEAHSSKGGTIEYGWYDGSLNNLAYRKDGVDLEKYIYDGNHCIAKYDGSGSLLQEFIYGPNIDEILCRMDSDGSKYYFHQDAINSVVAITD
ncbi:MAG: RHS repeat protein, partial [Candidatus Aureabacteria bacterium]|nr:RHS repeat protein [Candidatus Auribacterota bacterium]